MNRVFYKIYRWLHFNFLGCSLPDYSKEGVTMKDGTVEYRCPKCDHCLVIYGGNFESMSKYYQVTFDGQLELL